MSVRKSHFVVVVVGTATQLVSQLTYFEKDKEVLYCC